MKKISILGVGYVGIHSIVNLAKSKYNYEVVGYDINQEKIDLFNKGVDVTAEVGNEIIKEINNKVLFTTDKNKMKDSDIYIVAVPTDASIDGTLHINPLKSASTTIGEILNKDNKAIVVYESTVYPGLTEEVCVPIIEEKSGLKVGESFNVVYTPERVDPGNKVNTVKNTPRIISGTSKESVEEIKKVYEEYIVEMVEVSNIRTAESVKILENTQRDINIALMNNFAMLMDSLDIDFNEVLEAGSTKWNFLPFHPGMVGGHCIGVDPYYLIERMKQKEVNYNYIQSARDINEQMVEFLEKKITSKTQKKILYVGCTFKAGTNDIRNSKHLELIEKLKKSHEVHIYEPMVKEYSGDVVLSNYDSIVIGVIHKECDYDFLRYITDSQNVFNLVKGYYVNEKQWNLV